MRESPTDQEIRVTERAASPALDADVVIAGAGLSGLSLAVALLAAGLPAVGRIVLVHPPETIGGAARTW